MELVDLHVHSNISDGTLSPEELVSLAIIKQLKAIALTDHDTTDGVERAIVSAKGTALKIIPGSELSCMYRGKEIHILGLFLDYKNAELLSALKIQREQRDKRNEEMLSLFRKDGMSLTLDELQNGNPNSVITRAHFAQALVQRGYVSSTEQAFKKYLEHGKKYFLPKEAFTPEEAIALIEKAGGFSAVAHPMLYKLGWPEIKTMITEFKSYGLRGVEVYYSSHRAFESTKLRELCLLLDLLPTGGSDFHGTNKPDIELGYGRGRLRVSAPLLEDIKKRMKGEL